MIAALLKTHCQAAFLIHAPIPRFRKNHRGMSQKYILFFKPEWLRQKNARAGGLPWQT
jgi:hypothetical protein